MTPLEKGLGAALAVLAVGGGAFAIGQVTASPASGHAAAAPTQRSASPGMTGMSPGQASPSPSGSMSAPPESAAGYSNDQLATSIAKQAGTKLAGDSPGYLPAATARALASQTPPGARDDARANTITFGSKTVSFTVVAVPPGGPDMAFRIGGLVNPTLIVPRGATVQVRFINADPDEAHGWQVTNAQPPFQFDPAASAFGGDASARVLGDPTSAGDGTESIQFSAGRAGRYQYVCPMPGHARMGMHGGFVVSS
jgi:rusticyanin